MTRPKKGERSWTLAELADEAGISARTVRYYISRGLLEGPEKAGRGATYGPAHRQRLAEILRLQGEGLTLAEIAARGEAAAEPVLPEPEAWWTYALGDGLEVRVRADLAPWRLRQIRHLLSEFGSRVEEIAKSSTKKER